MTGEVVGVIDGVWLSEFEDVELYDAAMCVVGIECEV